MDPRRFGVSSVPPAHFGELIDEEQLIQEHWCKLKEIYACKTDKPLPEDAICYKSDDILALSEETVHEGSIPTIAKLSDKFLLEIFKACLLGFYFILAILIVVCLVFDLRLGQWIILFYDSALFFAFASWKP